MLGGISFLRAGESPLVYPLAPFLCCRKPRGRPRTSGTVRESSAPASTLEALKAPCMICLNSCTTSSSSRSARVRICPHRQSKFVRCSDSQSSFRPKRIIRSPHPHLRVIRPENSRVLSGSEDSCCMRSPPLNARLKPWDLSGTRRRRGARPPELHSTEPCPPRLPPSSSPERGTVQPPSTV
jgi:hypothetical protein